MATITTTKEFTLVSAKAPRLASATPVYDPQYVDALNNILRLYFNQLDNFNQSLISGDGGQYLSAPYGAFTNTGNHTAAAATVTAIDFDTTDLANRVSIGATPSQIIVQAQGVYNLQFSVQASNDSAQIDDLTIWMRLNGVDIPNSAGLSGVPNKHGAIHGHMIIGWNFMVAMNTGDYMELYWTTDSGHSSLVTYPASAVAPIHPASPSCILTMSFVSALPVG
jgi:hypothetical protein